MTDLPPTPCPECRDKGSISYEILDIEGDWPGGVIPSYEWCPTCDGGEARKARLCPECNGTLKYRGNVCTHCLGLGRMTKAVIAWNEGAAQAQTEYFEEQRNWAQGQATGAKSDD